MDSSISRLCLLGLAVLCLPFSGHAQIPGISVFPGKPAGQSATTPATNGSADPATDLAVLNQDLDRARAQLAELESGASGELPAGITPSEEVERRFDLVRITFNLERLIKGGESAAAATAAAEEAKRREREWQGHTQKPPYSFLFFDELRNQRAAAAAKLKSLKSTTELQQRQIAAQQELFRNAQQAKEVAVDKAARTAGTEGAAAAQWRLESASIRLDAAASSLAYLQQSIAIHQPRIAAAEADLALVERQLRAVADEVAFTEEDLATAIANSQAKCAQAEKEILRLGQQHARLLAERDRIRAEADKLRQEQAAEPTAPNPALTLVEDKLRAINAEEEALTYAMDLLASAIRIYNEFPATLKLRRDMLEAPSADERQRARQQLTETHESTKVWVTFVEHERAAVNAAIREQESRLASLAAETPERANAQRVLVALRQKSSSIEAIDQLISNSARSIERWVEDGLDARKRRSFGQRLTDGWASLWSRVGKVWNTPIYSYSDTVEHNGQTVTVTRGLTLGWLLGALVFFLVAYLIAGRISRRIQRTLVQRGWAGEAQSRTLRRWTMVVVGTILALSTLHLLKIPLTAFAFLGGALAIGFGFGTQTIFKNLISGVILLAERKIKVGDILDVQGVVGKVVSVDTRSSTLRGFDGIETLIPNSLLLENMVTNWTHTNARQRRAVRVGVAYGSPLSRVAEIMVECARRHGLVLDDPPPLVLFEDFGADSLVLGLFFWVELKENVNAHQIASDLRFMLDKRLTEAGITIAFPQRDIHLAAATAIPVRMVADPP